MIKRTGTKKFRSASVGKSAGKFPGKFAGAFGKPRGKSGSGSGAKRGAKNGPKNGGKKFVKESRSAKWKLVDPRAASAPATFVKKSSAAKLVTSLQNKKDRDERKLFIVEGEKTFLETLNSMYILESAFVTREFLEGYPDLQRTYGDRVRVVDEGELASMGSLASNNKVIGLFQQRPLAPLEIDDEIVIALCDVNDPGNLGTLIRIADWYGIKKIIASNNTVDVYNPKVISASKGSFARVAVHYVNLEAFLLKHPKIPVFGADMEGDDVHTAAFPTKGSSGILLLGNESHGISEGVKRFITQFVTIPRYGKAESLNVAIAGAIILDNWIR